MVELDYRVFRMAGGGHDLSYPVGTFESNFVSKSGQLFERRIWGKMDLKRSMGKRPFQYQYLGIISSS
jgi:hypothetical protein